MEENSNQSVFLRQFNMYLPYYAQFGQDKYLNEEVFKNKRGGVFVEIGAYDGITLSNTYFFEKEMGWTGVCVEPIPERFSQLKTNRKCICLNTVVSDKVGMASFIHVTGGDRYEFIEDGEYPKIKGKEHTEMLSGLLDYYNQNHIKLIDKEIKELGGDKRETDMECVLAEEVFNKLEKADIDYLSIDTEGSELAILKTIDFDKFNIDVIGFENLYPTHEEEEIMSKNGYGLIKRLGYDVIYRKQR